MNRLLLTLLLGAAVSPAAVITLNNPGFETGNLTGWVSTGSVAASGFTAVGAWTIGPAGSYMAHLVSSDVAVGDLETFFGLSAGSLSGGLPGGNGGPTDGAGIYQDFAGTAGDTVTVYWAYVAGDYPPFNDPAFAVVTGPGGIEQVTTLASIWNGPGIHVGIYGATGWHAFSYTLPTPGNYRIGFGVVDTGDTVLDSSLFLDGAPGTLSSGIVPEPGTWILISAGLAGLGLLRRRIHQ